MQSKKIYFLFLLVVIEVNLCTGQQPADKGANAKTKQVLDYITGLSKQGKFLSGQFAGVSNSDFNLSQVDQIAQETGQIPAILGCDYANGFHTAIPPQHLIDYSCNPTLIDHWNKDGFITINTHFPNPVSSNGGDLRNRSNLTFTDLLKPETTTGQRWRSYLDIVAEGFSNLQQANVTVLYRPFHEMNGGWFWWGRQNSTDYKNVWMDLFNYMTTTKNLHNLLWIYAPDQSAPNASMYYPGDDYVDIVALDVYVDDPYAMQGYDEMTKINKPFALGEVGPHTQDGQFDYSKWPVAIESKFTKISYFFAWSGFRSPAANKNASALYNNEHVVNRGEIKSSNDRRSTISTWLVDRTDILSNSILY